MNRIGGFEILTAVTMKNMIMCVVMVCRSAEVQSCF